MDLRPISELADKIEAGVIQPSEQQSRELAKFWVDSKNKPENAELRSRVEKILENDGFMSTREVASARATYESALKAANEASRDISENHPGHDVTKDKAAKNAANDAIKFNPAAKQLSADAKKLYGQYLEHRTQTNELADKTCGHQLSPSIAVQAQDVLARMAWTKAPLPQDDRSDFALRKVMEQSGQKGLIDDGRPEGSIGAVAPNTSVAKTDIKQSR